MSVWTTPTTRSTGLLVTASIWNTDIVNNLIYLKTAPVFDTAVIIGAATTAGVRLDLESGTLAVREGDDSAYAPLITSVVNLPSGGSINFASGDVTITHSTNTLTWAGASSGYIFNDGNVGIGGTPGSVRLDLIGSLNAIRVSDVTTDATTKQGKWLQRHYTNTEEDVMVAFTLSTSTANQILIGGGSGAQNAATAISFFTAANNTTTSGTETFRITDGNVAIGATARFYLDGVAATGNTYLLESSADTLQAVVGGVARMEVSNVGRLVFGSTAATILDDAGQRGSMVLVQGGDGTNEFSDLVMASRNVAPTVLASYTNKGTPSARTYTRSGNALQLAMASGTYTMVTIKLGS